MPIHLLNIYWYHSSVKQDAVISSTSLHVISRCQLQHGNLEGTKLVTLSDKHAKAAQDSLPCLIIPDDDVLHNGPNLYDVCQKDRESDI